MNKGNRGITLIALVITIIVLLILAGVTIAILTGENGIQNKANLAKNQNEKSTKEEEQLLNSMDSIINDNIKNKELWTGEYNKPDLSQGMIPVKFNGTNWIICDKEDKEWYEYIEQKNDENLNSKWANIMLSDGKYKFSDAKVGDIVKEEEIGSMFVWIPRYAYCIESGYHTNKSGKIKIEFLQGTTNISNKGRTTYDNKSGEGNWNIHPAFQYGDIPISGLWVAKYEASKDGTKAKLSVVPNVENWKGVTINEAYNSCIGMNELENSKIYGISDEKTKVDPHQMKNFEWGAVSYLTQSCYGRNGEKISTNETTITGNGGIKSSTTGNETGIYDLSGGTWEILAAYIDIPEIKIDENTKDLVNSTNKAHKDVYKYSYENRENEYNKLKDIYGDAIYETSNGYDIGNGTWDEKHSYTLIPEMPFYIRGGTFERPEPCSLWWFSCIGSVNKSETEESTFRPVISIL